MSASLFYCLQTDNAGTALCTCVAFIYHFSQNARQDMLTALVELVIWRAK